VEKRREINMCGQCNNEPLLYRTAEGFIWEVLQQLPAIHEAFTSDKELCVMYDDESKSLLEYWPDVEKSMEDGLMIVTPFKGAIHIKDIQVTDPDSGQPVDVSIYKDKLSGAMFGIDSSFPEDRIHSPYEIKDRLQILLDD